MKMKIIAAISVLLLVIFLFLFQRLNADSALEGLKNEFIKFDTTYIHGILDSYGIESPVGIFFVLKDQKEKFIFSPYTSEINNYSVFNLTAEKGDSILKSPFADTLYLFKKDKKYLYTFYRPK